MLNGMLSVHQHSGPEQPLALQDACARLRRIAHPGSLINIVSDFNLLTPTTEKHLQRLSQHCQVTCYHVSDPFERQLPELSRQQQLPVISGQQQQFLALGDKDINARYQVQQQGGFELLAKRLGQSKCQYIGVDAANPLSQTGVLT